MVDVRHYHTMGDHVYWDSVRGWVTCCKDEGCSFTVTASPPL